MFRTLSIHNAIDGLRPTRFYCPERNGFLKGYKAMRKQPNDTLLTLGVIAERAHVPLHRVEYFLRSRGIKERSRAGNLRVFDDDVVDLVRKELANPSPLVAIG